MGVTSVVLFHCWTGGWDVGPRLSVVFESGLDRLRRRLQWLFLRGLGLDGDTAGTMNILIGFGRIQIECSYYCGATISSCNRQQRPHFYLLDIMYTTYLNLHNHLYRILHYIHIYLTTYILTYLTTPTYNYQLTYLHTYLLTHTNLQLPNYQLTYLPTYLLVVRLLSSDI